MSQKAPLMQCCYLWTKIKIKNSPVVSSAKLKPWVKPLRKVKKVIAHLNQINKLKTSLEMPPITTNLLSNVINFILCWKETEKISSITNHTTTGAVCHRSCAWRGQRKWRASQSVQRKCVCVGERKRQRQEGWQEALTDRTASTSSMTGWTKSKEESLKTNTVVLKAKGSERRCKGRKWEHSVPS